MVFVQILLGAAAHAVSCRRLRIQEWLWRVQVRWCRGLNVWHVGLQTGASLDHLQDMNGLGPGVRHVPS